MTKSEVIDQIAISTGTPKEEVSEIFEATIRTLKKSVSKGETIYIRGFGTLGPVIRNSKPARNISLGAEVVIPARMVPAFKPAKEFRDEVIKKNPIS